MQTDEAAALPFQLQFDKPLASKVEIAAWNPEKDLLAMVTDDSKILLHRFNWQRLWTVTPGKRVTSICWRPDGKALAVGTEDGTISLHDVENGRLLRSLKLHTVAVICLNWEEDGLNNKGHCGSLPLYEDRTSRFFPPAPRVPRMPGVVSGDSGFSDDSEDSFQELSNSSQHRFNILCSGDRDGNICFSIFGIFPIAKVNIHDFRVPTSPMNKDVATHKIMDASIYKVAMSKDLCHLIVVCSGRLVEDKIETRDTEMDGDGIDGLHCLGLDTSIFWKRKNELHQVAQQASSVQDLAEVIRVSISIMSKQWSDAMRTFNEKFSSLSTLINDHGMDSAPQEEFLSLLGGARTSPPIHQFLVNSLGEAGMKRVSKVVCGAGKELQQIVLDHLQPAAEIIAFRMGELRGLSRWRARFLGIGLDEKLINDTTEKAGMLLVQIDRFTRVLSSVVQQYSNFFTWLHKSIKLLMAEPSDQLPPYNSELVVLFLKFLYDQDPVRELLELSEIDHTIEINFETMQRVKELVQFGGFLDCEYLRRTLAKEFQQMESSFKEALLMPFSTISRKILCENFLPLFPLPSAAKSGSFDIPTSISFYEDTSEPVSSDLPSQHKYIDYISFQIPDGISGVGNCIGLVRGLIHKLNSVRKGHNLLEAVLLCTPTSYQCVDMSLYKETQLVLLLNELISTSESSGDGCMMLLDAKNLPFASISGSSSLDYWHAHQLKDSINCLLMEDERVRNIGQILVKPLAVSASRGVGCVFGSKKRALVYILDEDEDEISDAE